MEKKKNVYYFFRRGFHMENKNDSFTYTKRVPAGEVLWKTKKQYGSTA